VTQQAAVEILVLEDSDEDFDTVREAAQSVGMPSVVKRATHGAAAIDMLCGPQGERLRPALVLVDLNLPGLDGREALQLIKNDAKLRHIPVVVLSTSNNDKDVMACYVAGANAYHVKPVRYEDHRALVQHILTYWLRAVTPSQLGRTRFS
jgi:CheY-like chemotaxis protein